MSSTDKNYISVAGKESRSGQEYIPADPLLTARQAAVETGRGLSTFWRDVKAGRVPKPYYISERTPRWRLSELAAAIACAPRVNVPWLDAKAKQVGRVGLPGDLVAEAAAGSSDER